MLNRWKSSKTRRKQDMSISTARSGLQLRSQVRQGGELELSLVSLATPNPGPDEVIIRIEATPINPSDLALLLAGAEVGTARVSGTADCPIFTASIPSDVMVGVTDRLNKSIQVGNEGAGVVVEAGSSDAAQALMGRTVAVFGRAMYAQYICVRAQDCMVLPEGTTAAQGASCFVNPLTALSMVETMRREGHAALVHTAAASSLGQMLNRLCVRDNTGLVNIVRKAEQADILRADGAVHVCNSSSPTFIQDLTEALAATGATIAFDAIGGGDLPGQILSCMETALNRGKEYSVYGSATHKQAYLYGRLDTSPTTAVTRDFGMSWGMGGWLLTRFLQKIGPAVAQEMKERVAREVKTTFASQYSKEISLVQALHPDVISAYAKRATGEKYLINPNMDMAPHGG
jgi:NADPH:quinone reductase